MRTSVDVPLFEASRAGRVTANLNAEITDLSDFGMLHSVGAGLTWRPTQGLRMIVLGLRGEGTHGPQLGDPLVARRIAGCSISSAERL